MSGADIVKQLAGLNEADRRWVIDRLSLQARRRLLHADASHPAAASSSQHDENHAAATPGSAADVLNSVDARLVADVLKSEPAWLIAAVLRSRSWSWHAPFLTALPEHLRGAVQRAYETNAVPTEKMSASLMQALATRVEGSGAPHGVSPFEQLVSRLSPLRNRRRLSLRP